MRTGGFHSRKLLALEAYLFIVTVYCHSVADLRKKESEKTQCKYILNFFFIYPSSPPPHVSRIPSCQVVAGGTKKVKMLSNGNSSYVILSLIHTHTHTHKQSSKRMPFPKIQDARLKEWLRGQDITSCCKCHHAGIWNHVYMERLCTSPRELPNTEQDSA